MGESILLKLLHFLPEEPAHKLALWALRNHLVMQRSATSDSRLSTRVFELDFINPVGLAAGFDKDAEALSGLVRQGFGFIETGTVTPIPQTGNDKPRLFRLPEDMAIINRMGFNGGGMETYARNLQKYMAAKEKSRAVIGANIGKNRDTVEATHDYARLIKKIYGLSDYITINVSSPNTKGLRSLQSSAQLGELLGKITAEASRQEKRIGRKIPLLLKIAPDLSEDEQAEITETVLEYGIDGMIIGNTTVKEREGLKNTHANELGGLSGKPLFNLSTKVLRNIYDLSGGKIPLIGCGGIFSAEDAYAKIRSGASLIQVYTGIIYKGFSLVEEINTGLLKLLEKDGFTNISEAVGADLRQAR